MLTAPVILRAPQNVWTRMAEIVKFERGGFVRFFRNYVECAHCEQQTRGRVYEESQQIICSVCDGVLLEIDDEPMIFLTLEEDWDGSA